MKTSFVVRNAGWIGFAVSLGIGCGSRAAGPTSGAGSVAPSGDEAQSSPSTPPAIVDVAPPRPSAEPAVSVSAPVAETQPRSSGDASRDGKSTSVRRDSDGLVVEDVVVGKGAMLTRGRKAIVHYDGTLPGGKRFDSSRDRGRPFEFDFGAGHVIAGWERGLEGMRVGGVRRLEIPPDLGYGARGRPPAIPPASTLVFEIELLGVQ